MKKVSTILLLLTCLKLSAAIPNTDSAKRNGNKHAAVSFPVDTPKTKQLEDSDKIAGALQKQDSARLLAAVNPASDTTESATIKDSPGTIISIVQPDKSQQNWFYNLPSVTFVTANTPPSATVSAPEPEDDNPTLTSLLQLDSLKNAQLLEQIQQENLRKLILRNEQIKLARILKINNLDSLKLELKTAAVDTIQALLYSRIAQKYMDYDTLSSGDRLWRYQNAAINYTLLAIQEYSLYSDSVGLRDAYANLSKIYYAQNKFTEAKWFILQANTLSRARRDTPNIISSLLELAAIKSEIDDYQLAIGDLNEALQLSITNHTPKTEVDVLKSYALLYSKLQDYPKEEMFLKKRDALIDSIRKADGARLAKAAALKKKQEALTKKKQYLASLKRPSKNGSQQKSGSL